VFTAVLQLERTADGGWDFLPQDLWVGILDHFVLIHCSRIGFSGIREKDDISRISCFSDWQPTAIGEGRIRISWRNEDLKRVTKEDHFALFEYSEGLHERLRSVHNTQWKSYDESYPVDELYFFKGKRVAMVAVPYEGSILFCELSEEEEQQLLKIDDRIPSNLHPLSDREVFSEIVER